MAIDRYLYLLSWSEEDQEYVATCAEFPSLSWLADTDVGALEGLKGLVSDVVADLEASGEPVPHPIGARTHQTELISHRPARHGSS